MPLARFQVKKKINFVVNLKILNKLSKITWLVISVFASLFALLKNLHLKDGIKPTFQMLKVTGWETEANLVVLWSGLSQPRVCGKVFPSPALSKKSF